jgi:ATP-dependent DNA helicase RecG
MPTTRAQLDAWLAEPEGARLEFKSARTNYHFDKLVEYCVALANEGGGTIVLGASDQRPRTIVGSAAFAEPGRTEAGLYERLHHRIPVEELVVPEGRVVLVHVPGRLPGTAWQINGRYLKRAGDDLVAMPENDLRAIFGETGPDFSGTSCRGATIADLDPGAISTFRARWAKRANDPRRLQWTDLETLTNAELLVDGEVTFAALILLGTRAALGKHLAQSEVVFEYRSTEATGPADERIEFREGFLLFHDALWERINLRNTRQSWQDGFFRNEVFTFDEVTVREGILNAVAHRDYRSGANIFVVQYPRALRITSPGGFPPGITTDNFLEEQNPRNRRLATALGYCGLVERAGQGLNLMFERTVRHSKPLPSFEVDAYRVRLTLDGQMATPEFVRFLERLGQETLQSFTTWDFLTLNAIERDEKLTGRLKDRVAGLINAGVIETVGRGRSQKYLLARSVYESVGRAGVHTRRRGLDHETKKALLLKHLAETELGSAIGELNQVLPAESRHALRKLLQELQAEGKVALRGEKRGARWLLSPEIPDNKMDPTS